MCSQKLILAGVVLTPSTISVNFCAITQQSKTVAIMYVFCCLLFYLLRDIIATSHFHVIPCVF